MEITAGTDGFGRLICTMDAEGTPVVVTASDAAGARAGLLGAIGDAEASAYGECLWPEAAGEYRWLFRRAGARLTVVVLWSSGTLTGWRHVLRVETGFDEFATRVRALFASASPA